MSVKYWRVREIPRDGSYQIGHQREREVVRLGWVAILKAHFQKEGGRVQKLRGEERV
jgi:hypothetical protein